MPKKVKISVIGIGLMGLQHIKAIQRSKNTSLHSIVEIKKAGTELAKKIKVALYKSTKILLESDKPDAVVVATPNILHETDTVQFLNSKIPVLLEKPISDNIKSAKKIISSAKKNKTSLLIGYHRRHNSIVNKVKKIIEGKVIIIVLNDKSITFWVSFVSKYNQINASKDPIALVS